MSYHRTDAEKAARCAIRHTLKELAAQHRDYAATLDAERNKETIAVLHWCARVLLNEETRV